MRRAVACGCALLAFACACSSSKHGSTPTTGAPTTTPRTVTTLPSTSTSGATTVPGVTVPPTVPQTVPPTGLASLILPASPDGFALQPDSIADTGPTDITRATNSDVSLNGREALVSAGFVRGYQRQWMGADARDKPILDFVFLYEFDTTEGAAEYAQHWLATLASQTPKKVTLESFTPAFIPGAFGRRVQDKNFGSTGVVVFVKGQYAVQAFVNGGPSVDESGPANSLAAAQYLRLP